MSHPHRVVVMIEVAAVVLLELYRRLFYRRHQLGSHVRGAVVRWETGVPRRPRSQKPRRRR